MTDTAKLGLGNETFYASCLALCARRNWWATYGALLEDGYDPKVDWTELYKEWSGGKDDPR